MARNTLATPTRPHPHESLTAHASSEETLQQESCGISEIIEILSRKWTLFILRKINLHQTQRFNELSKNIGKISPRTLSKRLKELKNHGLILRTQYNEIPPKVVYSLTLKGVELVQSFNDLDSWAKKWNNTAS